MSRTALTIRDTLCAIVGAANLLLCVLTSASALMMAVSVMMIGLPMYTTIDRLRTPTPRAIPTPSKLALEAKDQAAEAADLGLPTGVWIDLAATWTTWADQEEGEKAPEAPRERPKPPPGSGGAGNARQAVPWIVDSTAEMQRTVRTLTTPGRVVNGIQMSADEFTELLPLCKVEANVGSNLVEVRGPLDLVIGELRIAPTGDHGRTDLVVLRHDGEFAIREGCRTPDAGDEVLAEVTLGPLTRAVTQSMITQAARPVDRNR